MFARLGILIALVLAGCGGGGSSTDPTPTAPPPTSSATPGAQTSEPPATTSGANAFIGSIAVDPADGTVMLGTGLGLFRLDKGAKDAERVSGQLASPDGSGQVSSNLVVRYPRPGELLASGHPEGGSLPEKLGLISSRDQGDTWTPVAELGKSDYHLLQAVGDHVVGVLADAKEVRVSSDGGSSFADRIPPDTPLDVVFDPKDPNRMVVATGQGTFTSQDEGRSWRQRDSAPTEQLAWGDRLYRADAGGVIKVSHDGGVSWDDVGTVGATVNELALDAGGAIYASIAGGEVKRSTDGGATWTRLVKLK